MTAPLAARKISEGPVSFDLFLPAGAGPFPAVLITPLLGRLIFFEDLFFEKSFARFFAGHGLAAAVIHRPIFEFNRAQGLEQLKNYLEDAVNRIQRVFERVCREPGIDPRRVGSFGLSFGAVANALWAARDPRPFRHVFALAGESLADIFVESRDPLMKSYLAAALKKSGLNRMDLKKSLASVFSPDPKDLCRAIPKEKVLLILAVFDRVVPFRRGLAFRETLGRPKTYFLPLGHVSALIAGPFLRGKLARFLKGN
ncbi:MAG: alpha/beta hydrolase [Candidatus Omnitrophica bacterium]|nr:alpha/beta hydrolase [Candidatus Omnitrophota bacterium]